MKRLAALLLAIWLPMYAAAEAYSFSVSFTADETRFPLYLQDALSMIPENLSKEDSELIVRLVQCLLDGLSFDVHIQEDLLTLACSISGKPLMDISGIIDAGKSFTTSSLFPGYAFVSEYETADTTALDTALEQFVQHAVADEIGQAATQWYAGLEKSVESGSFSGDAYEGGTLCRTWVLSDSDISALLSALMTDDIRAAFNEFARVLDEEDLLQRFDALNAEVAEKDAHMYILRAVENETNELYGLSLAILRDMQQIATASLGLTKKGIKLVVGLGLTSGNYWWEFTADQQHSQNITSLSAVSREWQADKELDFSYVSAKAAPVSQYDWQCEITKTGNRYIWNVSICDVQNQVGESRQLSAEGKLNASNGEFDLTVSLGEVSDETMSMKAVFSTVEPQTVVLDDLELIDISDESYDPKYQEMIERATAVLVTRMLKILPADLFVKMLKMNPGQ